MLMTKKGSQKPSPKPKAKKAPQKKNPVKNVSFWAKIKAWYKRLETINKVLVWIGIFVIVFVAQAYAIAYWYQKNHANEPLTFGVTFIDNYAEYYDLDPKETMYALRDDLGFERFRLVSYWKDIEKEPGKYDFSELDWQFDAVNEVDGEVTLSIGLRQPRWPECHAPEWIEPSQQELWYPQLLDFMEAVIERYKDNPALVSYQLENEYYLGVFGECQEYGAPRDRLIDEFNFVKSLDPDTPVIISYANNYFGVSTNDPLPDQVGVSVYKTVYDFTVTNRYIEYPFPSWYYSWRAGLQQILTGRDSMLHELQTEPWTNGDMKSSPISEQDKTMDAGRLKERINYGVATGFRDIDLWGGEWWYWRKVYYNDPSLWETVRTELAKYN